jgi:hypothetical protein
MAFPDVSPSPNTLRVADRTNRTAGSRFMLWNQRRILEERLFKVGWGSADRNALSHALVVSKAWKKPDKTQKSHAKPLVRPYHPLDPRHEYIEEERCE